MGPNRIQPIHVGHDGTTVQRELRGALRQRKPRRAPIADPPTIRDRRGSEPDTGVS